MTETTTAKTNETAETITMAPKVKPSGKQTKPGHTAAAKSFRAGKQGPTPKPAPRASTNGKDRSKAQKRRVELVKVLKKLSATSATSARSLEDIAKKMGVERAVVYGVISGTAGKAGSNPRCLLASGHVKVASHEGQGLCAYLTAKGQKTDFTDVPFVN